MNFDKSNPNGGLLLTTSVGSLPKPDYLKEARAQAARGELSQAKLDELSRRATREAIEMQEAVGVDILVDGEMYRGDMVGYFAEHLKGFEMSGLVRSFENRYYHKPRIVSEVKRTKPITLEWYRFAQGLTKKPVKGMLTGPYTIMDWSFNEHYPSRRDTTLALAEVIHEEAAELERAGAQYIQIDEPALSTRPEEMEFAIEAMARVTKGLKAKTITHICFGDFEKIYPQMLQLAVDQIDLEFAQSNFALLEVFKRHPFTKEIAVGVVDIHSHRIETPEEVARNIRRALEVFGVERVTVDPDCGLKTRTLEEARKKLSAVVQGRDLVRRELEAAPSGKAQR